MTAVEKPLDIVIKTRAHDAASFAQLQRDLAAHSRLHGRVYVIVPRNECDQFAGLIGENYIMLTAEEVAAPPQAMPVSFPNSVVHPADHKDHRRKHR